MKILILVHEIGTTASGVINQRIIDGILSCNHDVKVIAAKSSKQYKKDILYLCSPLISSNGFAYRLFNKVRSFFITDLFNANYFWRLRAYLKAKCLGRKWVPDIIYCRTSPVDPCFVGAKLKRYFRRPLLVNLTDPYPAPIEYLSCKRLRTKQSAEAKSIISFADIVSMGTNEALKYQVKQIGVDFSDKAFISPDPVPHAFVKELEVLTADIITLTYLGSIYGSRNINPLISAIKRIRSEGISIKLDLYGEVYSSYVDEDFVFKHSYVSDIDSVLSRSDLLVDLDGDDVEPVFVSSKLKQYLCVDRPILSITPLGSPSCTLLAGFNTVFISRNNVDAIYAVLRSFIHDRNRIKIYDERNELLKNYSIYTVIEKLITSFEDLVNVKK